ncbi:hypothetical protein RFI_13397 [Reticulomyxa filosa]|uniref:Uncharacterized protein n=1 Tax=Reticulomyxa filosa TaxID=46433 RepID=X6ND07_RETFI|nr:hypothetical protein RFI_13397 [Reticulomyxa filosa]|eukprot:ETO23778.1 hypothetical protein RFI_13397 [Reticulomyxa filosa]
MDRKDFDVIKGHLCNCEKLLQSAGQAVVEAMMQRVVSDFQLQSTMKMTNVVQVTPQCKSECSNDEGESQKSDTEDIATEQIGVDFYKSVKDLDRLVLKQPQADVSAFLQSCTSLARLGCNQAHQMQNYMGPYVRFIPGKDVANKIINLAGQCENQWREVQSQIRNFEQQRQGNANATALVNGLITNVEKQLDGVLTNLTEIAKCNDFPKDVFVRNEVDSIQAVSTVTQSLVSTLKGNLKMQLVLNFYFKINMSKNKPNNEKDNSKGDCTNSHNTKSKRSH